MIELTENENSTVMLLNSVETQSATKVLSRYLADNPHVVTDLLSQLETHYTISEATSILRKHYVNDLSVDWAVDNFQHKELIKGIAPISPEILIKEALKNRYLEDIIRLTCSKEQLISLSQVINQKLSDIDNN
ncbi:hypothetical protein [Photobacterium leiognathi]|uniref:hypothetical protein n=1 Tax=Photobacterium leiognathi TaxID=553611 RepID=UPI002982486E|nr:hypothetical protein [Photobacterium leiognathi]